MIVNKQRVPMSVCWNEEDECYIATTLDSDLIGCGDTAAEAIEHLINHLQDEVEEPRKRPGRPKKFKQKIAPEVEEETIEKINFLKESLSIFGSQGDVIDKSVSLYYQFISSSICKDQESLNV